MLEHDALTAQIAELREALERLTLLHQAELDDLRTRHAAVVDALTTTYRDALQRAHNPPQEDQ